MGKLRETSDQTAGSPDGDPPLREAFENAERVFWCNTNRDGGAGGSSLEQRMHDRHFAAAWTWGAGTAQAGTFNYPDHMQRVRCGDVIVMYANELGVIAIGQATGSGLAVLHQTHPGRIRDYATEGENAEEWRIPVEWLVWDEGNSCPVDPLRPSFQEITNHTARIALIRQHFGAG
jgi:hypothetical protein